MNLRRSGLRKTYGDPTSVNSPGQDPTLRQLFILIVFDFLMTALLYIYIFIFGLIVGSFLNCVIYRIEKGRSFLKGRSFCPNCKHPLAWYDLIPVFSFLFLRGKCRYCGKKISLQYPLVEIFTATTFLFVFNFLFPNFSFRDVLAFNFKDILKFSYFLTISSLLILIFIYDLKNFIIPDEFIYPSIIIVLLYEMTTNFNFLVKNFILSAIVTSAFFLMIVLISKGRWMGMGDVKLAFFIGLFLGFPKVFVGMFLAFLIGAIIGIGLIFLRMKTLKSEVPFGPFLVVGTFIALLWGQQIANWYLNFFRI